MRADPCPGCGYIHATNDARALGRFGSTVRYQAASGGPLRATRAEAEADECRRRQARPPAGPPVPVPAVSHRVAEPAEPKPPPAPFPAVAMETAARAKAWRDFLSQALFSLQIWQLDDDVRAGCPHVVHWLRECRDDLTALAGER